MQCIFFKNTPKSNDTWFYMCCTLMIHGDLGSDKFKRSASLLGIYKSLRTDGFYKTEVADQRWQASPLNLIKQKL